MAIQRLSTPIFPYLLRAADPSEDRWIWSSVSLRPLRTFQPSSLLSRLDPLLARCGSLLARWPVGLRLSRFVLVGALLALGFGVGSNPYRLDAVLEASIPPTSMAQVFYSFDGLSYYPENNQILTRKVVDGKRTLVFHLRTGRPIKTIRLDLMNEAGAMSWAALTLHGSQGDWSLQGAQLSPKVHHLDQLRVLSADGNGLRLESTGKDPKLLVDVPSELTRLGPMQRAWAWLMALGEGALVAAVVEVALRLLRRDHRFRRTVASGLNRIARAWSDPGVLVFPASAIGVYAVIFLLAVVWVGAKLHQSSVGIWDFMYPPEHVERLVSLGSAKPIRSDEWGTLTPWILNQAQTGMKNDNANIGAPGSPMLAGAPVLSPVMLAQPKYWGFVLLDIERGFSWYWAYKSFGLVAAFFTLLLLLTRGDTVVSLAGALGVYGASYVQWWYSSVPSEVISGFAMSVVGTVYLLQARGTKSMVFGAVLAALSIPNLLLQLYPPFLLQMAYLAAFLLVALLVNQDALERFRFAQKQRWLVMGLSVVIVALLVGSWYLQVRDAAQVMMNTAYPGKRQNLGGDYPWYAIFYGVFESWKIDDSVTPFPPVNPSEASTFWILFPLLAFLVPWRQWRHPTLRSVTALMAYCLLLVVWTSVPLPHLVSSTLAAMGWSLVPAFRTQIGFAVASALMMGMLVAATARGELKLVRIPGVWLALLLALIVAVYGKYLQTLDPVFFSNGRIALGAGVVGLLMFATHGGRRWLFLALMVLVALPTMYVNPIQSGLDPYLNKRSFQLAKQVGGESKDKWAVFGDQILAQGYRAVGLQVINGTYYSPRADLLERLDPDAQYKDVWNRYAHVELASGEANSPPRFDLKYADHYKIFLDVCGAHIRAAGVTHVAYTYAPSARELTCLEPLVVNDYSGVNLYRLRALN